MKKMLSSLAFGAACAALPLAAHADLKTEVFVERSVVGADGVARVTRATAARAVPGDQILYVLEHADSAVLLYDRTLQPVVARLSHRMSTANTLILMADE